MLAAVSSQLRGLSATGRREGEKEFQIALNLMGAGKLDPTPLITHRFPLDEIREAVCCRRRSGGARFCEGVGTAVM